MVHRSFVRFPLYYFLIPLTITILTYLQLRFPSPDLISFSLPMFLFYAFMVIYHLLAKCPSLLFSFPSFRLELISPYNCIAPHLILAHHIISYLIISNSIISHLIVCSNSVISSISLYLL